MIPEPACHRTRRYVLPSGIAVLNDLGMSDELIARYFFVEPACVSRLRAMGGESQAGNPMRKLLRQSWLRP